LHESKFNIPHRLVTKWSLSSAPLESLNYAGFDSVNVALIVCMDNGLIYKSVGSINLRAKRPNI